MGKGMGVPENASWLDAAGADVELYPVPARRGRERAPQTASRMESRLPVVPRQPRRNLTNFMSSMRTNPTPPTRPFPRRRYAFLTLPNYSMIALTSAVEPLRMANRLCREEVYTWSIV